MARRKNTFTTFLSDIVDDAKDLVDDLLDRAKDAEEDLRHAVRDVVDDETKATEASRKKKPAEPTTADLKALHAAIAELTATVDALATTPTPARRSTAKTTTA